MKKDASGHALFITLIVLVLVASAVSLLATHYGLRTRLSSQEARRIHLAALVDAAVAESLAKLAVVSSFGGIPEREFGDGIISSQISSISGTRREILASATYRGWSRTVRVQVRLETFGLMVESWTPLPKGDR